MTSGICIRWLTVALAAALLAAAPVVGDVARDGGGDLKLQGTWSTADQKGSGTWMVRARVENPEILRGEKPAGEWELFSGTLSAAGFAGLAGEVPVTGWMTERNIGFRVEHPGWEDAVVSGSVDGPRVAGKITAPDGREASWHGWWTVPKLVPAVDGEPRLNAMED